MNAREQGLINKFHVTRTDGRSRLGEKHEGCDYFVLDLTHDRHAFPAIAAYARSCAAEYPVLATDLRRKIAARAIAASSFITVPESTLPSGTVVPSFRVGQYVCTKGEDGMAAVTADGSPWVKINYHEARQACADSGMELLTELRALAIAHDIAGQDINWTGGKVGEGSLYQGLRKGSVRSAKPGNFEPFDSDERRWHQLSNGERIYDFAGNAYSWIFDDVQGDAQGLTTVIKADSPSLQAPFPSMQNGMGWRPDGERDWSGHALIRGGDWRSGGNAGVFYLNGDGPDHRLVSVGFRCTQPGL